MSHLHGIRRTVSAGAAVTALLLASGCTSEQTSDPGPTLTSTTVSPTMVAATTPATTTTPPTSAPVESTAPATTTTAPTEPSTPTEPTDDVVALLIAGADGPGWLFLGTWQEDRWQEAVDAGGNPIRPGIDVGTPFTVSNLAGETEVVLGENTEACFDGRVGPSIDVAVAPPEPPGFGYNAVAVLEPSWALKPRPVAVTATAPQAYRQLGIDAFADEPVDATQGALEQLVVADLDGDGTDEALVSFEFVQPSAGPGAPGDLAALLVVDVDTRAADTVLLTAVDEAADADTFPLIERYRVLDVADLNGDGRMEVLVHAWYYEGAAAIVYTFDDGELTEVLSAGCGA